MILHAVLDVMDRPWQWGTYDCCTAASEVFYRLTGIDPSADLRGTYSTRREAMRIIRNYGDFLEMTDALAAKAGLTPTDTPAPGYMTVCKMPAGHLAMTICLAPNRFVGKTLTGFTTVDTAVRGYHA